MKRPGHATPSRAQRGATLLVSMIFMVVLTLIVISAIKVTNVNTRLVGNMQTQNEADAAAQQAIEAMISDKDFTSNGTGTTTTLDINGSGSAGAAYTVSTQPTCKVVKPIKLSELDPTKTDDQPCYASGASQNTGIMGGSSGGNSLCSSSNWDISATAKAPSSATSAAAVHQGIAVRVAVGDAC
jgi:hypothetical protein